mmetsp:Transcript_18665/g.58472  ORF Transcript_18665/g.58472 Transcript_18665/m.58472 type:complete len:223 (+) Transcript_18665:144-812(+)
MRLNCSASALAPPVSGWHCLASLWYEAFASRSVRPSSDRSCSTPSAQPRLPGDSVSLRRSRCFCCSARRRDSSSVAPYRDRPRDRSRHLVSENASALRREPREKVSAACCAARNSALPARKRSRPGPAVRLRKRKASAAYPAAMPTIPSPKITLLLGLEGVADAGVALSPRVMPCDARFRSVLRSRASWISLSVGMGGVWPGQARRWEAVPGAAGGERSGRK